MEHNIAIIKSSAIGLGIAPYIMDTSPFIIHSDTLFSAFCWCYRDLYGNDELESLFNDNKIILSSAFPMNYKDKVFYFPILKFALPKDLIHEKKLKGMEFVSNGVIEMFSNGKIDTSMLEFGGYLRLKGENEPGLNIVDVYRNRLDRITRYSDIFRTSTLTIDDNFALFFLFNTKDSKRVKNTIKLMLENGIGGDRSIGYGKGYVEFSSIDIESKGDRSIALSLVYPTSKEANMLKDARYKLVLRGGYTDNRLGSIRKDSVRMLIEGSIIPNGINGSIVKVNDKPNVYRYGLAYKLGVSI